MGLEQIFDLIDDPMETKNLVGEPRYEGELLDCREKLFGLEAGPHRRPLSGSRSRDMVRNSGGPLRERWAAYGR